MNRNFLIIEQTFLALLPRQLVEKLNCSIEIRDERSHISDNCHTARDTATSVMVHKYGPHIFNIDNDPVWKHANKYGDFRPFLNRVRACTSRGMFSMPINRF